MLSVKQFFVLRLFKENRKHHDIRLMPHPLKWEAAKNLDKAQDMQRWNNTSQQKNTAILKLKFTPKKQARLNQSVPTYTHTPDI